MGTNDTLEAVLSLEDVWKRVSLLRRVVRDVVTCYGARANAREFLDELRVIHKKFSSPERLYKPLSDVRSLKSTIFLKLEVSSKRNSSSMVY